MKEYKEKISSMTVEELKAEWDDVALQIRKSMNSYVVVKKRTSRMINSSGKRL